MTKQTEQQVTAAGYDSFIFHNTKVYIHSEVNIEGPLIAQELQDRNGFYVRI